MVRFRRRAAFDWDPEEMVVRLRRVDERTDNMIAQVTDYQATRAEAYAKANAPWTDRTSNARNGLFAIGLHARKSHTIVLSHVVSYGIWLEVRWNGRYAIIEPTMQVIGRDTLAMIQQVWRREFGR